MGRIIIDNRGVIEDAMALGYVRRVMHEGRISREGTQYCYMTRFSNNEGRPEVIVSCDKNKASDRFMVYTSEV